MTKREEVYRRIKKHGEDLINLFGLGADPVKLCKKLRKLERQANQKMADCCNGELPERGLDLYLIKELKPALEGILGVVGTQSIYINHDPRGYTLKLNEPMTAIAQRNGINIYRDLGGYGIIAPDLSN